MEATLPLVFCGGFPKSLHQLNEAELERFLVYVWNFTGTPEHAQVFPDAKCYDRSQSLRQLICSFYERLGLSYLLYFSEGLAKTKGSNIYYEIDRANKNIVVWNKRTKSIIAKIPASNVCYDSFSEKIPVPKIKTSKSPSKKKEMGEDRFPVIDKVWSDAAIVHVELFDSDEEKLPDNEEKEVTQESIVISDSEEPVTKKKVPTILRSRRSREGLPQTQSGVAVRLSNGKEQGRKSLEESQTSRERPPDVALRLSNGKEQGLEEFQRSSEGLLLRQGRSDVAARLQNVAVASNEKCSPEVPFISESVSVTKLLKENPSVPFINESISVTKVNLKSLKRVLKSGVKRKSEPDINPGSHLVQVTAVTNGEIVISDSEEPQCQTPPHRKVSNQLEEIVISDSEDVDDIENKRNYLYRLGLCDSTNEPDDPIILPVPGKGDFSKFHRLPLMMVPLLVKHSLIDKNCINPGPPGQNIPSTSTNSKSVTESVKRSNKVKVKYGRYRTLDLDSCRDYHFPKKHYKGVVSTPLRLKKAPRPVPQKNKKNTKRKSNQGITNYKIYNPVVKVKKLDERIYLEHLKKCV